MTNLKNRQKRLDRYKENIERIKLKLEKGKFTPRKGKRLREHLELLERKLAEGCPRGHNKPTKKFLGYLGR